MTHKTSKTSGKREKISLCLHGSPSKA